MVAGFTVLTLTHRASDFSLIGLITKEMNVSGNVHQRLFSIKETLQAREILFLSTCNRVTFVFYHDIPVQSDFSSTFVECVLSGSSDEVKEKIHSNLEWHRGEAAIVHLYRVASSLDSLVVGEREIFRQLREAYNQCYEWRLCNHFIKQVMGSVVETAKAVFSNTKIGEKPISVVSLAMSKVNELSPSIPKRYILVGAGQTIQLVTKFLKKESTQNIHIFNRNLQNAEILAQTIDAQAYSLDELQQYKGGFDVLIVCTGATTPIITPAVYDQLTQGDSSPKVVVDLSVPNNVSSQVAQLPNVHYVDVESLRLVAQENLQFREKEMERAKELIQYQLEAFKVLYHQRLLQKAIQDFPVQVREVKRKAIDDVFKQELDNVDDVSKQLCLRMMDYLEQHYISLPMKATKELC